MATIALRDYYREIEGWLDQGLYDQVISHSRYILNSYPKAIEPYQLLGKAYLENKQYSDAIDLFQRVLSSRPDDFVAHIGMSIIREDEGNLNEAIWHMERAYEIQPSNKAIQGELRRLIGKRDGIEPVKINLNRSALARMYLKGNLQSQAIAEIRMALTEDPKRPDLQVLLAKAYYELNQEKDAADVASQLLSTLPYCFDAILILYRIAAKNNKQKEAQLYLNKLIELDPYAAFLSDQSPTVDLVADTTVMIEPLAITLAGEKVVTTFEANLGMNDQPAVDLQNQSQADWLSNLAEESASEQPSEADSQPSLGEIPDWLGEAGWEKAGTESGTPPEQEIVPPFSEEDLDIEPGEIPDWLKELSPTAELIEDQTKAPIEEGEIESILAESAVPLSETESMDWLEQLETKQKQSPVESNALMEAEEIPPQELDFLGVASEGSPKTDNVMPDWLSEQTQNEEDLNLEVEPPISELDTKPVVIHFESTNIPLELSQEESPDWVKEYLESQMEEENLAAAGQIGVMGEDEKNFLEESAVPDWLEETLAEKTPQVSESLREDLSRLPEDLFTENEPEDQQPIEELSETDIPDWFEDRTESLVEEKDREIEESAPEELPDWIKGALPQDTHPEGVTESEKFAQEELPDWIRDEFGETTSVQEESEKTLETELPDWISTDFVQIEEETSIVSEEGIPPEELSEWIKAESSESIALGQEKVHVEPSAEELESLQTEQSLETSEIETPESSQEEEIAVPLSEETGSWQKEFEIPQDTTDALNNARLALHGGELEAATAAYATLIKQKTELDAIISDLTNAVYQYPMNVKMWMLLGDAYLRKDLLSEALNAYNKAEELIR